MFFSQAKSEPSKLIQAEDLCKLKSKTKIEKLYFYICIHIYIYIYTDWNPPAF